MDNIPKKFVGLHAHSVLSIGDGLGKPKEHIDFAVENGMDALALTDHGNMDGMAEQLFAWENLKKKGVNFKALPGVEAYFIDSLTDWQKLYEEARASGAMSRKKAKKNEDATETPEEQLKAIGDDSVATQKEVDERYGNVVAKEDDSESVMENEEESKDYKKFFNPIKQRNHLVLLPKNKDGLKSLFKIVSESYKDGYYAYPRVDFDSLRRHANGNIIASSACLAGRLSATVAMNQIRDFQSGFDPASLNDNFDVIQKELARLVHLFQEALGEENYYLELQFNKIPLQHIINYHLIECSKQTGAPLIVTCDSHYARPEYWREREIYKAMVLGTRFKNMLSADALPKKIEDLKCELYPKNAEQVWDSYKFYGKDKNFYKDDVVKEAIERTWTIAHEQISNDVLEIDRKIKLPSLEKVVSSDEILKSEAKIRDKKIKNPKKFSKPLEVSEFEISFEILKQHAVDGLVKRKLSDKKQYIDRLITELDTVKHLRIVNYFLTYEKIMKIVSDKMLTGAGRGSACGSLLAYVLGITQVDPIRFGLLFERFLSKKKAGWPDIDSDSSDRDYALKIITEYFGEDSVIAISTYGQLQMKSLIRDLSRLHNIPLDEVGEVTLATEKEARAAAKKNDEYDGTTWFLTYDEAKENSPTFNAFVEKYPEIESSIKVLFKNYRSCFTKNTNILTENGNMPVEIVKEIKPMVAFVTESGEIDFNQEYDVVCNGEKEVFEVVLEDGTILELTEDHEVLTENGYKKVSDLSDTDCLVRI